MVIMSMMMVMVMAMIVAVAVVMETGMSDPGCGTALWSHMHE